MDSRETKECPCCRSVVPSGAECCDSCGLALPEASNDSTTQEKIACPFCTGKIMRSAVQCKHCGTDLIGVRVATPVAIGGELVGKEEAIYCTECGNQNRNEAKFCANCGTPLHSFASGNSLSAPVQTSQPQPLQTVSFETGVSDDVLRVLPHLLQVELIRAPRNKQLLFVEEYRRKARTTGLAYLFWFLGFHHAYLEQWALLILFWVTLFLVIGIIWWIIDLFRVGSMVKNYNQDCAMKIATQLNIIGG